MILHLSCQSCGIGIDLPAAPAEAADRLSALREGFETTAPVQISGVEGPIPNLPHGGKTVPSFFMNFTKERIGYEQVFCT